MHAAIDKSLQSRREPLVLVGKIRNNMNGAADRNQPQKIPRSPKKRITFDLLDSSKEDIHPRYADSASSYKAKAKFAYNPSEPDELTFSKNDLIDVFGQAKVE